MNLEVVSLMLFGLSIGRTELANKGPLMDMTILPKDETHSPPLHSRWISSEETLPSRRVHGFGSPLGQF